jgi:cell division protein FtsA
MNDRPVIALDVGASKIVALAATARADGELWPLAVATAAGKGVRKGLIEDVQAVATTAESVIRKVEQTLGEEARSVVAAVGGPHLQSFNGLGFLPIFPNTRPITRDDVLQVINHSRQVAHTPQREQIQAIPKEFRIDSRRGIENPVGMSGGRLEVTTYIVTGHASEISRLERAVTTSGKRLEMLVCKGIAAALGSATMDELHAGAVVADIGEETIEIAAFAEGGILHVGCLPVGARHYFSDVKELLRVSPEEARRLVLSSGCADPRLVGEDEAVQVHQAEHPQPRPMQRRVLCEILESRASEMAGLVRKMLDDAAVLGSIKSVILTGGGSRLKGLPEVFGTVFGEGSARTGGPQLGGELAKAIDRPEMASVVGLARFALQTREETLVPVGATDTWQERVRTFWTALSS